MQLGIWSTFYWILHCINNTREDFWWLQRVRLSAYHSNKCTIRVSDQPLSWKAENLLVYVQIWRGENKLQVLFFPLRLKEYAEHFSLFPNTSCHMEGRTENESLTPHGVGWRRKGERNDNLSTDLKFPQTVPNSNLANDCNLERLHILKKHRGGEWRVV